MVGEAEEWSNEAVIYVNGVRQVLPNGLAHLTLLQYLRGRSLPHSPFTLFLCVFSTSVQALQGLKFGWQQNRAAGGCVAVHNCFRCTFGWPQIGI